MDTFFDIEAQERSRVTKLGAQTQHRVVLRLVPPSASKQSEIVCARDKCVVFHNIGKAISGSTVVSNKFELTTIVLCIMDILLLRIAFLGTMPRCIYNCYYNISTILVTMYYCGYVGV